MRALFGLLLCACSGAALAAPPQQCPPKEGQLASPECTTPERYQDNLNKLENTLGRLLNPRPASPPPPVVLPEKSKAPAPASTPASGRSRVLVDEVALPAPDPEPSSLPAAAPVTPPIVLIRKAPEKVAPLPPPSSRPAPVLPTPRPSPPVMVSRSPSQAKPVLTRSGTLDLLFQVVRGGVVGRPSAPVPWLGRLSPSAGS